MTLGEKICALRKEKSFTQAELGNALGVTYQAVSKWERDESMPDFGMISKLAKLFGVPISYFENNGENVTTDDALDAVIEVEQNDDVEQDDGQGDNVEAVESVDEPAFPTLGVYDYKGEVYFSPFKKRAIIAAVVAGAIALTILIVQLVFMNEWRAEFGVSPIAYVGIAIAGFIVLFTWIFQLFFDGAVRSVTLAGLFVIKLPGIIFSADLDGLIFLIAMKILFFIITVVVFVGAIVVTSFVAMLISLFTFIPLIVKIVREDDDILDD